MFWTTSPKGERTMTFQETNDPTTTEVDVTITEEPKEPESDEEEEDADES